MHSYIEEVVEHSCITTQWWKIEEICTFYRFVWSFVIHTSYTVLPNTLLFILCSPPLFNLYLFEYKWLAFNKSKAIFFSFHFCNYPFCFDFLYAVCTARCFYTDHISMDGKTPDVSLSIWLGVPFYFKFFSKSRGEINFVHVKIKHRLITKADPLKCEWILANVYNR